MSPVVLISVSFIKAQIQRQTTTKTKKLVQPRMDKIILNVRFADVKFVVAVRRTQTISEAIELSKSALKSIYNSEGTAVYNM